MATDVSTTGTAATTAAPAAATTTTTAPAKGGMKEKFMEYGVPVLVGGASAFGGMKLAQHFKMNKWIGIVGGFAVGAAGTFFAVKHFTKK